MNEIETFYGLVENTLDALRIFQMCRDGRLNRVRRRLHERERRLIRSGSIFVFDEEESGIRRWTDGRLWSPSRILGNFLIYRELEKKGHRNASLSDGMMTVTATGTKRQAHTQFINLTPQSSHGKVPKLLPKAAADSLDMLWGIPSKYDEEENQQGDLDYQGNQNQGNLDHCESFNDWMLMEGQQKGINPQELAGNPRDKHRILASSSSTHNSHSDRDPTSGESLRVLKSKKLTNNHKGRYIFKLDGLIKKTISIQLEGHTHHLVAYYSLEDFCRGHLQLEEGVMECIGEEVTETETGAGAETGIASSENTSILLNTHQIVRQKEFSPQAHINYQAQAQTQALTQNQTYHHSPFDPQLMEILRQVPIPVDLMLQQNFRKPAALLASATSSAQNFMAGNPENGEKLITALEYGAINPSDLQSTQKQKVQQQKVQLQNKKSTSFVSGGGGIIFSSSPTPPSNTSTTINSSSAATFNQRSRRHSSFHPFQSLKFNSPPTDPLNLLDESSQLSGEALEFLSHFSDDQQGDLLEMESAGDSFNFLQLDRQTEVDEDDDQLSLSVSVDLETELFGSILSSENGSSNREQSVIRGHDVLLSDTISKE